MESQERHEWAAKDPVSLVAAAKEGLRDLSEDERRKVEGPLDEIIGRFEAGCRASFGTAVPTGSGTQG
jgi:hypothetical protein